MSAVVVNGKRLAVVPSDFRNPGANEFDEDRDAQPFMPRPSQECPLGIEFQNYWELLSLEEKQWKLDQEGLYSLTIQQIAVEQAKMLRGDVVIDAFCGSGGNAIAFAREGKQVVAVESNKDRLEMAKANAKSSGVYENITFITGDSVNGLGVLAQIHGADAVFLDPPWGGPGYVEKDDFGLKSCGKDGRDYSGLLPLALSLKPEVNVGIKLPVNFRMQDIDDLRVPYVEKEDIYTNPYGVPEVLHKTAYFFRD